MEIHPPHESAFEFKQIALQLAIVTAGILIALSFEGILSRLEHRALVREAEANLLSEIRDNKKEIDALFDNLKKQQEEIENNHAVVRQLLNGRKLENMSLNLNFWLADLGNASHATAEATGAFGYMDYEDVKKYARVYDLQRQFLQVQDRGFQSLQTALSGVQVIGESDGKAPERDLQEWRQQLRAISSALTVEEQLGRRLQQEYERLLKGQD